MAKSTATTEEIKLSPEAQAARDAVANRPRQSVVRFVELYVIIRDAAPEKLEEYFGSQIDELEAVADKVENKIAKAIETATSNQLEIATKALENNDPLNGYASYVFDEAVFEDKTKPKVARVKKTVVDKAQDLLSEASDDDLRALQELLAARGL